MGIKRLLFTALFLGGTLLTAMAQSDQEVSWKFSAKKIAANTYEVTMKATINDGWHLYAQDPGEGPIPTSFKFTKNPLLTLEGTVKEVGKLHKVFESAFGSVVGFYENTVSFVQIVKVKGTAKPTLTGTVEFGVCDDKSCLPPSEVPFKIAIGG